MAGIKETSEGLVGVNEVGVTFAERLSDGLGVDDFDKFYEKLMFDVDFKAKIQAAWENRQQIPAEVMDIDLMEAGQLAIIQIGYIPKYIEALKAKAAA